MSSRAETGRSEAELRETMCLMGRRLHAAGLVAGTAGNLSARACDGDVIMTPRGVRKDGLRPEDLVRVDLDAPGAEVLARATTEWRLHRACLSSSSDVQAAVHTHAPALTAVGLRRLDIAEILPEVAEAVGGIVLVAWAPSGSEALGNAAADALLQGAGVLLLERHGAVSVGRTLEEAFDRTELAELSARAILMAG